MRYDLNVAIMPWSWGYKSEVVFGGRNVTQKFGSISVRLTG